eukprot:860097-Prymnesium_polylepis.1
MLSSTSHFLGGARARAGGVSFALFGATVTGPVNFYWLSTLDRIVRAAAPQGGPLAVCCKVGRACAPSNRRLEQQP